MTTLVGVLLVLLALASTFGAGLELNVSHVRMRGVYKAVAGALVANLLIVPVVLWLLIRVATVEHDLLVALTLIAVCPGGASAPLLARLAGGDATRIALIYLALCLSCLASVELASVFLVRINGNHSALPVTLGLQLLPLVLGAALAYRWPLLASKLAPNVRRAGSVLLIAVVLLLAITRSKFLATLGITEVLVMVALASVSLCAGALVAPSPRLPIAMLTCIRNLTLALLISELNQPGGRTTLMIAAYGLVMYLAAFVTLVVTRRRPRP